LPGQLDPIYDIQRIRYPDGQPEPVAEYAFWPRISPEADRIVYISIDPETAANELVIANADGSEPQKVELVTPVPVEIIDAPIFTPDGQSLLFSVPTEPSLSQLPWYDRLMGVQIAQAHDVPSDWWSVPLPGGEPTQLTRLQTINLFASLSPDKTRIASVSAEGLFVMGLDGSELTQLVRDPNVHGTVSWIP
jgi:Tol biopolymer transport system component